MTIRGQFRASDWVVLAGCCILLAMAIGACLIWIEQGIAYSDLVGIEPAPQSRIAFRCRAEAALGIAIATVGTSLLLRVAHLRATRRTSMNSVFTRGLIEQVALVVVTWTLLATLGSPPFLGQILRALVARICGTA